MDFDSFLISWRFRCDFQICAVKFAVLHIVFLGYLCCTPVLPMNIYLLIDVWCLPSDQSFHKHLYCLSIVSPIVVLSHLEDFCLVWIPVPFSHCCCFVMWRKSRIFGWFTSCDANPWTISVNIGAIPMSITQSSFFYLFLLSPNCLLCIIIVLDITNRVRHALYSI